MVFMSSIEPIIVKIRSAFFAGVEKLICPCDSFQAEIGLLFWCGGLHPINGHGRKNGWDYPNGNTDSSPTSVAPRLDNDLCRSSSIVGRVVWAPFLGGTIGEISNLRDASTIPSRRFDRELVPLARISELTEVASGRGLPQGQRSRSS